MRHIALNAASIEQTLDEWTAGRQGAGIVALLPEAEKDRLPLLQAACRERAVPLAGAIFPALVDGAHFVSEGAWLLHFPQMPPHFLIPALNGGAPGPVDRLVGEVRRLLPEPVAGAARPTLFMVFDGMVPNIASILDGIYLELANQVEYGGVNAGSESFQPMPCLFDEYRLVGDGVLGLLLPGELAPFMEHGFSQPERAMTATSTAGNRIAMIDWQPAFDVYQALIKSEYGIDLTRENFYQYGVHFPFGILRANGDVVVRIPVALSDDGALYCVGEVPENTMLVLLKAPAAGANGCIDRLAERLGRQAGGQLLTFYCAGRRLHLGSDAERELAALGARTGAAGLAGALSLGEIGSTTRWGYPMFHNATLVCAPWAAP
jgi:hypothetical protein